MTRKDYVLLAVALKNARPERDGLCQTAWLAAVTNVSDALMRDNPRFVSGRFLDACGVNVPVLKMIERWRNDYGKDS